MKIRASIPKSKTKDLQKIRARKQNRNANTSERRKVVTIDTEAEKGNIFLIADFDVNRLDYREITFDNIFKFLLHRRGKWIFFYN